MLMARQHEPHWLQTLISRSEFSLMQEMARELRAREKFLVLNVDHLDRRSLLAGGLRAGRRILCFYP